MLRSLVGSEMCIRDSSEGSAFLLPKPGGPDRTNPRCEAWKCPGNSPVFRTGAPIDPEFLRTANDSGSLSGVPHFQDALRYHVPGKVDGSKNRFSWILQ